MQVRPKLATTVLLELNVVDVTEDWLEKEDCQQNEADDGMEVDGVDLKLVEGQ